MQVQFPLTLTFRGAVKSAGASGEDTLVRYGGEVKSLGDRKVGGYLVLFGTPEQTDLEGDFFTKSTDFDIVDGDARTGYYNHGLDLMVKNRKVGRGSLKVDETGVWLEAQLSDRDEYCDAILELVDQGALGLSSGAVSHLVRKEEVKSGVFQVTNWPIGEWSLTPTPAEPRTKALPLKSLSEAKPLSELVAERGGKKPTAKSKQRKPASLAIKSELLGDIEFSMCLSALDQAGWALEWRLWDALYDAQDTDTPIDYDHLTALFDEYRDICLRVIRAIMAGEAEEDAAEATTAMKSALDRRFLKFGGSLGSGLPIEQHASAVVSAVDAFVGHAERKSAARGRDGRKLSEPQRAQLKAVQARLDTLLAQPAPEGETSRKCRQEKLRQQVAGAITLTQA